ncbi:MAG: prepilin-type N-terminal cleavage/methylation domain-containing protein [Sulfuricella sp.]|nr:prepilin-type N-terminal cleavage/methylation domain-containing protein [Sulfuricella sp.]
MKPYQIQAGGLRDHGFTLVELLVVTGILATLAYLAWGGQTGVQSRAEDQIARSEILRLADALRRFRADTGYYPGQGPFALAAPGTTETGGNCAPVGGVLRSWTLPAVDADRDDWFDSPINLALLFERPALCGNHPQAYLAAWNPDTRRGWNGPYLDRSARAWTDHGANFNLADGSGDPLSGSKIDDIPAFGVGPGAFPAAAGWNRCTDPENPANACMLGWRTVNRGEAGYDAARHELTLHARPFPVFGLAAGDAPRVTYWGADGRYGGRNAADPCRPNGGNPDGADDLVLCLEGN